MKVCIITIGDEILFGQIVDSNSAYIARMLNEIGLEPDEIISIHDEHNLIIDSLNRLTKIYDIIIMTGGLGPTKDDLTKKALAGFLACEMRIDQNILKSLEERLKRIKLNMNGLNHNQALIPEKSTAIPNPLGTAPGIWTEHENSVIINLPGVPFEMKNLIKTEVIPRLQHKFSLPFVVHHFLSVSNFPESELALQIAEWEDNLPEEIKLAYLPERGKVKLRITARGNDKIYLEDLIANEIKELLPYLGNHLDSAVSGATEEVLADKLKQFKLSLSTAESCTGGMIAHLITSVPGSSAYYKGSVISYATKVKENLLNVPKEIIEEHTVVSEEVAIAMAKGVRLKLNTDLSVSTSGVAGPAKGEDGKEVGTAWIAVTDGAKVLTKSYFFPYLEREDFILQISKLALQRVIEFIKINYQ